MSSVPKGVLMEIGEPKRTITVEPVKSPVPEREPAPERDPGPAPEKTPERVPEKVPA
jgi:hypothetical protein